MVAWCKVSCRNYQHFNNYLVCFGDYDVQDDDFDSSGSDDDDFESIELVLTGHSDGNDDLNDDNDNDDNLDVGNDDNDDRKDGDLIVTKRKSIGRPLHLSGQAADRAPEQFIPDCSIYNMIYISS